MRSGTKRDNSIAGPAPVGPKDRNFVTALARGLEILRAFGAEDEYLGNAEIARRTRIPRPTVSRLTYTLTRLGYLRYLPHLEKYHLGAGVLALGFSYLGNMGIRHVARPSMQELADATDCQVALGVPDQLSMTYLETCQGKGPLVMRLDVGSQVPIATTAMGRAYLAALPEARRNLYLQRFREADPAGWRETGEGIDKAVQQYREKGFCILESEWHREVSAVGVPLVLDDGSGSYAFNCGGSSLRLSRRILEENLGPRLLDMVQRVQRQLAGKDASLRS